MFHTAKEASFYNLIMTWAAQRFLPWRSGFPFSGATPRGGAPYGNSAGSECYCSRIGATFDARSRQKVGTVPKTFCPFLRATRSGAPSSVCFSIIFKNAARKKMEAALVVIQSPFSFSSSPLNMRNHHRHNLNNKPGPV